jgi:hypothetical protein
LLVVVAVAMSLLVLVVELVDTGVQYLANLLEPTHLLKLPYLFCWQQTTQ